MFTTQKRSTGKRRLKSKAGLLPVKKDQSNNILYFYHADQKAKEQVYNIPFRFFESINIEWCIDIDFFSQDLSNANLCLQILLVLIIKNHNNLF